MSLALVTPFSGSRVGSLRNTFPRHGFPVTGNKSSLTFRCSLTTIDLMQNIKEKINDSLETAIVHIPSNLCVIDTLQRLGPDRYFQSEIDTILESTYMLWQQKHKIMFSNVTTHAMAFRLLRVKGYEISSEELAPYDNQDGVSQQTVDVAMVIELYRAAHERIDEEERCLVNILGWTTTFLNHQLHSKSIPDKKLHKLVEFYMNNYHGIPIRLGVRRNLDLYDMSHYQALRLKTRFSNICNEDFVALAMQDFTICQAQYHKELQQLQRWYADCRLDTLKFGRQVVFISYFLASLVIDDCATSAHARLAFTKTTVLATLIDDFFDYGGSRKECYNILELVNEWKEKASAEYESMEVEIIFTALYNTVNELAVMASVAQGRSTKEFIVGMWVEVVSSFKVELDAWSNGSQQSLDEYMSTSWLSVSGKIVVLMALLFIGVKLSDEMLMSEECTDLSRHVSIIIRLINDVCSFEKERKENKGNNCMSILLADGRGITEEEAIAEIKEIVENHRRKLMQIVYTKGTILPRRCRDIFVETCKAASYVYTSSDEFTTPQKLKEDMKSFLGL
ncbi:sclareol synthase, chloroplastic-like isoform X2 [Salvia hispanica]|uniref:sclareol synthase, chloroplastic-like isoform X2 n=1 Tax=Salvia hispanica TaxID=49212 RepID=UPI002009B00D|nr:sclareol synthase, chloroplastic-like isoform X2 [Salvia hispanica]